MRLLIALFFTSLLVLTGCEPTTPIQPGTRVLVIGDSMMAWNRLSGQSVANVISRQLSEPVADRSVSGALMAPTTALKAGGIKIYNQYRAGDWDWVVLNGGGNDLIIKCGCGRACGGTLDRLVSADGRVGDIAATIDPIRAHSGAKIIYVSYLRSPGFDTPIDHCKDEADVLENRMRKLAARRPGVYFVTMRDLVPHGDKSYVLQDLIHPSPKGSAAIGQRIAGFIRRIEGR